jgi:hypothetical protein
VDFNEYAAYYGKKDDMMAEAGNMQQVYQQGMANKMSGTLDAIG